MGIGWEMRLVGMVHALRWGDGPTCSYIGGVLVAAGRYSQKRLKEMSW